MIHESRSPPGSCLDLASNSWNSDVVFLARFPRRLGRPYTTSSPSPLLDGVPLFSAPQRQIAKELMHGAWPRGYK
jgi:hypothetical protein